MYSTLNQDFKVIKTDFNNYTFNTKLLTRIDIKNSEYGVFLVLVFVNETVELYLAPKFLNGNASNPLYQKVKYDKEQNWIKEELAFRLNQASIVIDLSTIGITEILKSYETLKTRVPDGKKFYGE